MRYDFSVIPAGNGPAIFFYCFVGFMLVTMIFVGFQVFSFRNIKLEISPDALRIKGGLRELVIAAAEIDPDGVRAVDLTVEPGFDVIGKVRGTTLPGYRAGRGTLRNGEKAQVYLTDRKSVVYIPTRNGYSLLMSVAEPETVVAKLRGTLAPGSGRGASG